MEPWWTAIAVAVIGGPCMWLLNRFDKHNTEQHAKNMEVAANTLAEVKAARTDIARVERRVDRHMEWHSEHPA